MEADSSNPCFLLLLGDTSEHRGASERSLWGRQVGWEVWKDGKGAEGVELWLNTPISGAEIQTRWKSL